MRDPASTGFAFNFQGSAEPFSTVAVTQVGGAPVGKTVAGNDGHWQMKYGHAALADGQFSFQAIASDAQGVKSAPSEAAVYRPNFVLVNTDDMAAHDLSFMPHMNQLLASSGTTFTNSFVPTSLSGPSRAALLTGQYAHTNGVFETFAPLGGELNLNADTTLPQILHNEGYRTAAFGKSETHPDNLESSRPGDPPLGWDEFSTGSKNPEDATIDGYYYFRDGTRSIVPQDPGGSTAVWADLSKSFIQRNTDNASPFLLYFAPGITHSPYNPTPQYAGSLDGVAKWRPPSYNIVPPDIQGLSPHTNIGGWDATRQRHLETLQSVDEAIQELYSALADAGKLDNTVFVFTADNGLMWGEHGMFSLKDNFFDESLRVPLVIRDGRAPAAQIAPQMALNIDIVPTFAHLAGISLPNPVDGVDLSRVIHGSQEPGRFAFVAEHQWTLGYDFVHEGYGTGGVGVRTQEWKYVEYQSGKRDLFHLTSDPFEMHNLGADPRYSQQRQSLAWRLRTMLPSDKSGPIVRNLSQRIEFDAGLPYLRLTGSVSDVSSGGSQVRSPEYFIDRVGNPGWGQPLDFADGGFNATTEAFRGRIPLSTLASLGPGVHTLYVRGRDIAGNWGALVSMPLILTASMTLDGASDTGGSQSDGVTLDRTPTIHGTAAPDAALTLFDSRTTGSIVAYGSVVADSFGNWLKTLSLPAGAHKILGVVTDTTGQQTQFTEPLSIHVVGYVDEKAGLRIVGTSGNDDLLVKHSSSTGETSIFVNGVAAGTLFWSGKVQIDGLGGNDTLTMDGNMPALINGGEGDDVLRGGTNNDVLRGDAGSNRLIGGDGDDRYVFTLPKNTKTANEIVEFANRGFDTLDFSLCSQSLVVNFAATPLARVVSATSSMTVRGGQGAPLSYEAVIGGSKTSDISVPNSVRVLNVGSNNRVTLLTPIASGTTTPIKTLSVKITGEVLVRCVLTSTQGSLQVSPLEPDGNLAGQVIGNGTNHVKIIGTRTQIYAALKAFPKLTVPKTATTSSLIIDLKLLSQADGSTLEHHTTTIQIKP